MFPPGFYYNPLLKSHKVLLQQFRDNISNVKLNLSMDDIDNVMKWIKHHVIIGKWENQGKMYDISSEVRYILSFIHKQYTLQSGKAFYFVG